MAISKTALENRARQLGDRRTERVYANPRNPQNRQNVPKVEEVKSVRRKK